ncbi:MAG: hypothetical protein K9G62_02355 [Alphaproteobacteria bacterium]|nr:hypothetical protein [Alphaproteobacteria bacterium]
MILRILALALLSMGAFIPRGFAACVPGLPCVVPLTPNSPTTWPISPNTVGPNAPKSDTDLCDADFMNQIYARAFLEADRENILNKLLIPKPDSVLEYTCFDKQVAMTAGRAGPLFTETSYWHDYDVPIDGMYWDEYIETVPIDVYIGDKEEGEDGGVGYTWDKRLDNSLQLLVMDGLSNYLGSNFAHPFMGGRLFLLNHVITGILDDIIGGVFGPSYNCSIMDSVYRYAKCVNFGADDKFYSFETLAVLDPRLFPTPCGVGNVTNLAYIRVAENKGFSYAAFDKLKTMLEYIRPGSCTAGVSTGVTVKKGSFSVDPIGHVSGGYSSGEERVCINPGCSSC